MTKKHEINTGLYLVAMIGIVAVIGLVVLVMNSGGSSMTYSSDYEDLVGEAGKFFGETPEEIDFDLDEPDPVSDLDSCISCQETYPTGSHSTAIGFWTKASGSRSTAMGGSTEASGTTSTAMGSATKASGDLSTAMGYYTLASGDRSTAMGSGSEASGDYSTAMGIWAKATHENSFVVGLSSLYENTACESTEEEQFKICGTFAVDGLPTSEPDASGTAGIVCVTNDGGFWIDNDGTYDCQ
jgi:hypothetical protein